MIMMQVFLIALSSSFIQFAVDEYSCEIDYFSFESWSIVLQMISYSLRKESWDVVYET
jgi:hypothetical protein